MANDKFLFKVTLFKSTQGYTTKVEVSKGTCQCGDYGLQDHLNSRLANNLGFSEDTLRGEDGKGPDKSKTKTWLKEEIPPYLVEQ